MPSLETFADGVAVEIKLSDSPEVTVTMLVGAIGAMAEAEIGCDEMEGTGDAVAGAAIRKEEENDDEENREGANLAEEEKRELAEAGVADTAAGA